MSQDKLIVWKLLVSMHLVKRSNWNSSFIKRGRTFGIEATNDFIESRAPLDFEALRNSETQMDVGLYNIKEHTVEYFDKSYVDKDMTLIKASCALLLLSRPYMFNNKNTWMPDWSI